MTLQVIGALCILIALIGGELKFSEVEIPRLSARRITALVTVGVVFIALGVLTGETEGLAAPAAPTTAESSQRT